MRALYVATAFWVFFCVEPPISIADGDGRDRVVIDVIPKPMPPAKQQLDKGGINGLILIVGIGLALWIAFRGQGKNFRTSNDSDDKRSGDNNV